MSGTSNLLLALERCGRETAGSSLRIVHHDIDRQPQPLLNCLMLNNANYADYAYNYNVVRPSFTACYYGL